MDWMWMERGGGNVGLVTFLILFRQHFSFLVFFFAVTVACHRLVLVDNFIYILTM